MNKFTLKIAIFSKIAKKIMETKIGNSLVRDTTSLGGLIIPSLILLMALVLKEYSLFISLFLGLFFSIAIVVLIRTFYFKERPNKQKFKTYFGKIDACSFPSLHTARAFYIALILANFWGYEIFVTITLLFIASLVAISRLIMKKHDFIDVTFGFILALLLWSILA
jgi:membrane-associated phospholipid phosphatase